MSSAPLDAERRARVKAAAVDALLALPERIGRYRIHGELGRGGMGIVYDAWDPELARPVAVKVIRPEELAPDRRAGSGDDPLARFEREGRATARCFHPNLVAILDAGVAPIDGEARPYFVMEHVDGESLEDRLRRRGPLEPDRALDLALAVARGLAAAHARGLVHRDLKPSNVLLPWRGEPRVSDFGLCLSALEPEAERDAIVGSAQSLAPEQLTHGRIDARADLFGLGALLLHAHSGRAPFAAASLTAQLDRVARAAPDGLECVPPDLRPLAERLMAKEPAQRPSGADEVVTELEALKRRRARLATRRRRTGLVLLASGVVLAMGLVARHHAEIDRLEHEVALRERTLEIQLARARDLLPALASSGGVDTSDTEARLRLHDEWAGVVNRISLARRRHAAARADLARRRVWLPWSPRPPEAPAPEAGSEPRLLDLEGMLSPAERAALERQLELLERELDVDARLWIERRPEESTLEAHVAERFASLARGREAHFERALLIWIDPHRGDARIEVGHALEPHLPDSLLGSVLREVALANARADNRELAWRLALRVVRHRLRRAVLAGELAPAEDGVRLPDASGGGGATVAGIGSPQAAGTPTMSAESIDAERRGNRAPLPAAARAAFAPGATPAEAIERYHDWLAHGRFDSGVELLTRASRALVSEWPITPGYRRHLLDREPRGPLRYLVRGDAAIAFAVADPLAAPSFLQLGAGGWQVDLEAQRRHLLHVAGGTTAWSLRAIDRAPLDRFRAALVVVDGFIRLRDGDNRPLEPGLLARSPGARRVDS